jgi:microcystin-dependent protein
MTAIRTSLQNAFQTQLSAEMGPNDTTAQVDSIGGLSSPCYIVINYDQPSLTEFILFDGTFGASSFVTSNVGNRYLSGSAAGSNITHPIGSKVICAPVAQHIEDLHDRLDGFTHASLTGLGNDDHTQYPLADGTRGFSGPVVVGEPSVSTEAATKSYVDAQVAGGIAAGFIMPYAGASAPGGWLLCDGSAVSRATYNDLWTAIGTDYGSGDGSTTFNVPDLVNRSVMGAGSTVARTTTAGALTDDVGSHTHTMPSHTHTMAHVHDVGNHTHSVSIPSTTSTNGAHTHTESPGSSPGAAGTGPYDIDSAGNHSHTVTASGNTGNPTGAFDTDGSSASNTGSADPGDTNSGGSHTVDILHPVIGMDYYIKT